MSDFDDTPPWPPRCDRCGKEIDQQSALIFGLPKMKRESRWPMPPKLHVCVDCWFALVIWLQTRGARGYSPETIAAYAKAIEAGFKESLQYVPSDEMLVALRNLATMVHCDLTGELRKPHTHLRREFDWTLNPETGRHNESREFKDVAASVESFLKESGWTLLNSGVKALAHGLVVHIAHNLGLAPKGK